MIRKLQRIPICKCFPEILFLKVELITISGQKIGKISNNTFIQFQKLEKESTKEAVTEGKDSVGDPDRFDKLMEWFG